MNAHPLVTTLAFVLLAAALVAIGAIVTAVAADSHVITASGGAGGSISPAGAVSVADGADQTFAITPATGYVVTDVVVDGVSQGAIGSYTFTNVQANHTISATFTIDTYTITPSAGAGGSITPNSAVSVDYGASQTCTITPDIGYHTVDVSVDGVSQGAIGSYTFTNVQDNHTISATFAVDTFSITTSPSANGTITPSSPTVNYGSNQTFLIVPDSGYHTVDVVVDGTSQGTIGSYTFYNVTAPGHTISATFASDSFTISASAGSGGSISPSGTVVVANGASQTCTITPDVGHHTVDVVVDGSSQGPVPTYTFTNVQANHTITATFASDTAGSVLAVTSAHQPAAAFVVPSSTRAVGGFRLARSSGTDTISVTAVTVTNTGAAPELNVGGVYVYRDDGDNAFGGTDVRLNSSAGTFNGPTSTVTFDAAETVGATPVQYFTIYDFAAGASDGATATARVSDVNASGTTVSNTSTTGSAFKVDALAPTVAMGVPLPNSTLTGATTSISGTASDDAGSGVTLVEVMIQRSDGQYWSGSGWSATATWLTATGTNSWYYGWVLDPDQDGSVTYTISARAHDAVGSTGSQTSSSADVRVDNATPPMQPDVEPPHVVVSADSDVCAMCHRSHTSASSDIWTSEDASATERSSLIVGIGGRDVDLCYTCHGGDMLGSGTDVQTPFESGSGHALAPQPSDYGPTPKECDDCHDPHGTARNGSGQPYPSLLRSLDASQTPVYAGDSYCATCHPVRSGSTWDGLSVWRTTAHSTMPGPASGTGIVCSNCHDPHGSPIAPTIAPRIYPPAAPATAAVSANDRTTCLACHDTGNATWAGSGPYSASSHASSLATVAVPGEWPDAGASRRVGECQVCHNPMGEDDGSGHALPKLVRASGETLCYQCHDASGPASTDMKAISSTPASSSAEVAAAFSGAPGLSGYGQVLAYTQDSTTATPRPLVGPRILNATGAVGALAAGDVDGDGKSDVLVADPSAARIDVFSYDKLRGLSDRIGPGVLPVVATAELVGVGDVFVDGSGLPEIVVVDQGSHDLWVYRYSGSGMTLVDGPVPVGNVTGMTIGDVEGSGAAGVVLTTNAPDSITILAEQAGSPGVLQQVGALIPALSAPVGPSIGDVWTGGSNEIVVVNAGETTRTVSVFRADGTHLGDFDGDAGSGQAPTASSIGNVLSGRSGPELLVTYADPSADSRLDVFPTDGGSPGAPLGYDVGTRYNPAAIAVGDADGDSNAEVLLANAGSFTRDGLRQRASIQVFHANASGDALVAPETKWAGGAEMAGGTAGVVVADFGPVGRTEHPVGAVPSTHVSTETATVARHVECSDCHNSHVANNTGATAPTASGPIKGTWGVAVRNDSALTVTLTSQDGIRYEYELCLKCHSSWSDLQGSPDFASLVNTQNASVHAVEAPSADANISAGSFEPGWDEDSVMYCTTCHASSISGDPAGPHRSDEAPILARPYWGVTPADSTGLCYQCHRYSVYFTGADDTVSDPKSAFFGSSGHQPLHSYHTDALGFGCASCHVSHGAPLEPHLLRSDIGYTPAGNGGSCANGCHTGDGEESYTRP